MRKQNMPLQRMMSGEALLALARDMRYPDVSSLYAAVGESQVSAQHVVQRLVDALGGVESAEEDLAEIALPTRRKRGRPPETRASSSPTTPTCGCGCRAAAPRCRATTSSGS